MSHPIDAVVVDNVRVPKEDFRDYIGAHTALVLEGANDIQTLSLASRGTLQISHAGREYWYDASDGSSEHNGLSVLVSADGRRYKPGVSAYTIIENGIVGYSTSHTFPEAYGNVATKRWTDIAGDTWRAHCSYSGTTTGSVRLFARTGPGTFAATPTQTLNVSRPRGIDVITIQDVATFVFITSNINNAASGSGAGSNYYDTQSLMFFRTAAMADYQYYETINTYGAVIPKFFTDGSSRYLSIANSVSSTRNTKPGGTQNLANCFRQSIDIRLFANIGTGWPRYQEIMDTKGVYAAPMWKSQLGLGVLEVGYYDDQGIGASTPGYEPTCRAMLFKSSGTKFGTVDAAEWTFPVKGGGDGEVFVTNAGHPTLENTYMITTSQRDISVDTPDDYDHFSNTVEFRRLNVKGSPSVIATGDAFNIPVYGVQNNDGLKVSVNTLSSGLILITFSNANTGGGGENNAFFSEGHVTGYLWDVKNEVAKHLFRIPANGPHCHDVYEDDGRVFVGVSEFAKDNLPRDPNPNNHHIYTLATREFEIGTLSFMGLSGQDGDTGATGATGASGAGYAATSTTSLTIGTGTKAVTTQAGLAYSAGARVRYASTANTANWVEGLATTYSGTSLTINADLTGGSGTAASWTINLAGERGATGATGPTGPEGPAGADGTGGANNTPAECYLDYVSATSIKLARMKGQYLWINGLSESIPSGGVTLSNSGMSANTNYYIYAYMSGATMTLEGSTTVPVVHTDGTMVKTGVTSRALVGLVRADNSAQFNSSATKRLVLSWFNQKIRVASALLGTNPSTTSAPYVELTTAMRIEYLNWANNQIKFRKKSQASGTVVGQYAYSAIGYGTTLGTITANVANFYGQISTANYTMNLTADDTLTPATDSYYWATLTGGAGSNTADFPNAYNKIEAEVWG